MNQSSGEINHEADRQNLLSRLIDSVKECQLRFGGKGELATESDSRVAVLCAAWENTLRHGIKPSNRALAALKSVSEFTGLSKIKAGIFQEINDIQTEPVFWHVVRDTLSRHELERFTLLKHVVNDSGRGRAWLRSALNEKSLERQLSTIIENTKLMSQHYEEWALLRDMDRRHLLNDMASGLASIMFAITIDSGELNKTMVTSVSSQSITKSSTTGAMATSSGFARLFPNSLLNSFQKPPETRPVMGGGNDLIVAKGSSTGTKKAAKLVSFDKDDSDDDASISESGNVPVEIVQPKATLQRNDSRASILSNGSAQSYDIDDLSLGTPTSLTPLNSMGVPINIPLPEDDPADLDVPNLSCSWSEDAVTGLSLASKTRSSSFMRTQGDGSSLPEDQVSTAETMTTVELKQAIVTMMMKKDEVEEQNRVLRSMLTQEEEYSKGLKAELQESMQKYEDQMSKDQTKVQSVMKDNELLKHQLKKYINAVQMLRRDGPNAENLGIHLDAPQPTILPSKLEDSSRDEATEFKRQLIQVAEMHGELMEFNEHLQKQLLNREHNIRRLRHELVSLRGPLPSEVNASLEDDFALTELSEWRPLVNIWMPSVFLKGANSSSHHVYQVFLRIKDDEWNVYRRYSEFYSFYSQVRKAYPLLATYEFPPKKAVGNKNVRFVDERRKKLELFLRKAVQHIVSNNQELKDDLCRTKLVSLFPFLGDIRPQSSRQSRKDKRSKGGASVSVSPNRSSPVAHYGGL